MKNRSNGVLHVVVVDRRPQDYELLTDDVGDNDVRFHFLQYGHAALDRSGRLIGALWLINTDLPDMTGAELLELIRARQSDAPIFLVGDHYSHDDELAARTAGASAYLCKPPTAAWLPQRNSKAGARLTFRVSHLHQEQSPPVEVPQQSLKS